MTLTVTFLFIYFYLSQNTVLGNESRAIVEIVRQHYKNDGWAKCLIVTMGLNPLLQKDLGGSVTI
jgi:hypothetical protein